MLCICHFHKFDYFSISCKQYVVIVMPLNIMSSSSFILSQMVGFLSFKGCNNVFFSLYIIISIYKNWHSIWYFILAAVHITSMNIGMSVTHWANNFSSFRYVLKIGFLDPILAHFNLRTSTLFPTQLHHYFFQPNM